MKLTAHKRGWVMDKVVDYCDLLNVFPPIVLLTRKEYSEWVQKRRQTREAQMAEAYRKMGLTKSVPKCRMHLGRNMGVYLGVCHTNEKMIAIMVKRHHNLEALDNTIRHELIHYAKPSYNHRSREFSDRMDKLLKGQVKNGRF